MSNSAFEQKQVGNASLVQAGAVQEPTQAEFEAGVDTGSTGARLFVKPSQVAKTMSFPAWESITKGDIVGISHYTPLQQTIYDNQSNFTTKQSDASDQIWYAQRFTVPLNFRKALVNQYNNTYVYVTTNTANSWTYRLRSSLTGADIVTGNFTNNYATVMTMHNVGNLAAYLVPGSTYYLIMHETTATDAAFEWGYSNTDTNPPEGGESWRSTDAGANWTEQTDRNYIIRLDGVANGSNGHYHVYKSSAAAINDPRFGFAGVALNDAAEDEDVVVTSTFSQVIAGGLTAGADYYLSNTPGQIQTTPGTVALWLGHAVDATRLVRPQSFLTSDGIVTAGGFYFHMAGFANVPPGNGNVGTVIHYNRVPPGAATASRGGGSHTNADNPSSTVGVAEFWQCAANGGSFYQPFIAID